MALWLWTVYRSQPFCVPVSRMANSRGCSWSTHWLYTYICMNRFRFGGLEANIILRSEVKWKSLSRVQLFVTPWNLPGQNTGVGSPFLRQGTFPTQGLNLDLPHCRWILYQLSHRGSPIILRSSIKNWVLSLARKQNMWAALHLHLLNFQAVVWKEKIKHVTLAHGSVKLSWRD